VVTEAHCKYLAPARYDDVLVITTHVDRLRPTRIDFRHRVAREEDGAPLAEGHLVLACVDGNGRPRGIPTEVREAIEVVEVPDV
jgi:acyl-CoA thioester hydrolase